MPTLGPVLQSYVNEFAKTFSLEHLTESKLFEYFSAYCSMFRDFSDEIDLEDVVVGEQDDGGMDAIGLFLNEINVTTDAQVETICQRRGFICDFVFVQAKTSKGLSVAELGSFLQGVNEFFSQAFMPLNEEVLQKQRLKNLVFENSVRMKERPRLVMYYCYTGRFQDDDRIMASVHAGSAYLKDMDLFSDVDFIFLDADSLQNHYKEINLRIEREIVFNEFATLPQINGIRHSYLGVLPCSELVKLLSNSDGKLHKSLFNENVRDFLSSNPVNDEIESTLCSPERQDRLPALNNGITIVAKSIRPVGKKFTLSDFQIVNGCQTSHLIFENREKLAERTSIPVKLIEVEDKDLVNEIVRATNRQTEVKDEAFEVLGEFHKRLERFFEAVEVPRDQKIVYERRKRQYVETIYTSKNIVTLTGLINSFVSGFLGDPVAVNNYYGVTLRRFKESIFREDHSLWPYYVSAALLKKIEQLCSGAAKREMWRFRFILCLLIRRRFGPAPCLSNDRQQEKYCRSVLETVWNEEGFMSALRGGEEALAQSVLSFDPDFDTRNAHQNPRFLAHLLSNFRPDATP